MSEAIWGFIGVLLGIAVSYWIANKQIKEARKVSGAELILAFDTRLNDEDLKEVHKALRPGGRWYRSESIDSADDWIKVEAYMGAFERLEIFMREGLVNKMTAYHLYAYRIGNILQNDDIVLKKLYNERSHWDDFIKLCNRFDYPVPSRNYSAK